MARFNEWLMGPSGLAFDRLMVRFTGVSIVNRVFAAQIGMVPQPALLLETKGRKSGEWRQVVLPYYELDDRLFIVASKGGAPSAPQWQNNLEASAEVGVYLAGRRLKMKAELTEGEDYQDKWDRITETVPTYEQYQAATERRIAVVELIDE